MSQGSNFRVRIPFADDPALQRRGQAELAGLPAVDMILAFAQLPHRVAYGEHWTLYLL